MTMKNRNAIILLSIIITLYSALTDSAAKKPRPTPTGPGTSAPRASADHEERAEQLVAQARNDIDRHDFRSAQKALLSAAKLYPKVEVLLLLCRIAESDGNDIAARDLCRRYQDDPSHAESERIPSQQEVAKILSKPIAPHGEVAVFGAPGAVILVDDRLVGNLPLSRPLLLEVGQHKITLIENDRKQEWPVKTTAGRTVEMRFEPESSAVLVTQLPAVMTITRLEALSASLQSKALQSIDQAIQVAHFANVPEKVAIERSPSFSRCADKPECQLDMATQNNSEYVLQSRVVAVNESKNSISVQIGISLLDVRSRLLSLNYDYICHECTTAKFATTLSEAVRQLISQSSERVRGELLVTSNPKADELLIDGISVGSSRFDGQLPIGVHSIEVRHPGYISQRSSVVVDVGKASSMVLMLVPKVPLFRLERPNRPAWRIALAAGFAGIGAGLLSYGISGFVVDGTCAEQGPSGVCRYLFSTRTDAVGLSIAGGALVIGGLLTGIIPQPMRNVEVATGGFGDPSNE